MISDFSKQPIVLRCAEMFSIHPRDLVGDFRFKFLMPAKFALCTALRAQGMSYPKIGKLMGRDHSSVIYAVDQATWRMGKDETYKAMVLELASIPLEHDDGVRQTGTR